mmetsp:Transcript_76230/g.218431  ORF Transcript_76230/g.218431 Transcript_76230/m.218431 type:complete len:221 (+) Transcript_76230:1572-2234(+)
MAPPPSSAPKCCPGPSCSPRLLSPNGSLLLPCLSNLIWRLLLLAKSPGPPMAKALDNNTAASAAEGVLGQPPPPPRGEGPPSEPVAPKFNMPSGFGMVLEACDCQDWDCVLGSIGAGPSLGLSDHTTRTVSLPQSSAFWAVTTMLARRSPCLLLGGVLHTSSGSKSGVAGFPMAAIIAAVMVAPEEGSGGERLSSLSKPSGPVKSIELREATPRVLCFEN